MKTIPNTASTLPNSDVRIERWRGGQHPTLHAITQRMEAEALHPYPWQQGPNARMGIRSHGYYKLMYCVEGTLEVFFPDLNQRVLMRAGDRIEIPRTVRYALIVGPNGARCVEAEFNRLLS